MKRRTLLACAAVPLSGSVAGCLASDRRFGVSGGEDEREQFGTYELRSDARVRIAEESRRYGLAVPSPSADPYSVVVQFQSRRAAETGILVHRSVDERRDQLRTFVTDTDFRHESLFFVETTAPNACLSWQIESFEWTTENAVRGRVSVQDEDVTCGNAHAYPSLLLRVTGDAEPPTKAILTITNGWGETETVESSPFHEYLHRRSTAGEAPPEPGATVTIPGVVYNDDPAGERISVEVASVDGKPVFETSLEVTADRLPNVRPFAFEATVGTQYTAVISDGDSERSTAFTASGGRLFEIRRTDADLSAQLLSFEDTSTEP